MKTKKIISWAVALCMGVMLHSCDLDQKVFSSLTNANFPQTVEDIDVLVVGMYANFKANSGGMWDDSNGGWAMPIYAAGDGWWAYSEFTSDECRHQGNRLYDFNWAGAWDTFMTYTISRNAMHLHSRPAGEGGWSARSGKGYQDSRGEDIACMADVLFL